MKIDLQHVLDEAARLTRSGDLRAATAAIQAALRNAVKPAAADLHGDVLVEEPPVREARDDRADGPSTAGRFECSAGTRDYTLYLPPGGATGAPLVLMLHGCTQDADDFATGTHMNAVAARHRVAVLYPSQAQHANTSKCWNWFQPQHQQRERGEPELLAALTRHIVQQEKLDGARVYVAGLSAGGAMAAVLGETYPELYAAVGVHSGLPTGAARDVQGALHAMQHGAAPAAARPRSPRTIVFHGDRDTTVHPNNGEQLYAAAVAAGATVDERTEGEARGRRYTRRVALDDRGRVRAEHWLVHGAGHAWSGGNAEGSHTDDRGPDASAEMLRFFLET